MEMESARAGDGIRTHDNDVGNVVLYQLSYTRMMSLKTARESRPSLHTTPQNVHYSNKGTASGHAVWQAGL